MTLTKELESVINKVIVSHPLPFKKGNSIRIGQVIIRKSKTHGHILFDALKQTQIAITYSKSAALAVAKCYIEDRNFNRVLDLDKIYQKHDIDCMFYQHIIDKSDDTFRKKITFDRFEIASELAENAKQDIESILFDK